jgi:hypothetical protein
MSMCRNLEVSFKLPTTVCQYVHEVVFSLSLSFLRNGATGRHTQTRQRWNDRLVAVCLQFPQLTQHYREIQRTTTSQTSHSLVLLLVGCPFTLSAVGGIPNMLFPIFPHFQSHNTIAVAGFAPSISFRLFPDEILCGRSGANLC